jgi:2-amino-4-hydroxy-6-hydroxymethyldihydropteridine diphosphokinase
MLTMSKPSSRVGVMLVFIQRRIIIQRVGIYLGLGSNIGDREDNLRHALSALKASEVLPCRSAALYSTEPRDFENQPWFLNTVVEVLTSLEPQYLLQACLALETSAGRIRTIPSGPRAIDIDILLYDEVIVTAEGLRIPHPRFRERRFVLVPLVELAPEAVDPVSGRTMRQLLDVCSDTGVVQHYGDPLL